MWSKELPRILRFLVNDLDPNNPVYSDERLQEIILVNATLIQMDIDFNNVYTIDIEQLTLSPDPTGYPQVLSNQNNGIRDNGFINLVCYSSACLIERSTYRTAAQNAGYVIQSDREKIDTSKILEGFKELFVGKHSFCEVFNEAKWQYKVDSQNNPGISITSAISSPNLITYNWNGFMDLNVLGYWAGNDNYSILSK